MAVIILVFMVSLQTSATGFEGMVGVSLNPTLNIPIGDWSGHYGVGPGGSFSILAALPTNHLVEFSVGVLGPSRDDELAALDLTPVEMPVNLGFIFPLSAENATTAYFGLGPSWILLSDVGDDCTRGRAGYQVFTGFLFAPEQFRYTFFDLRAGYYQYIMQDEKDVRNLNISLGMGLKF